MIILITKVKLTGEFDINIGRKQRNAFSTILFDTVFKIMIIKMNVNPG